MKRLKSTSKHIFEKFVAISSIVWILLLTGCDSRGPEGIEYYNHWGNPTGSGSSTFINGRTTSLLFTMKMLGMDKIPEPDFQSVTLGIFDSFHLTPFSDTTLVQHVHSNWQEPLHPQHSKAKQALLRNVGNVDSTYIPRNYTRHGTLVNSLMTGRGKRSVASKGMAPGALVYRMNIPTYVMPEQSGNSSRRLYIKPQDNRLLADGLRNFVRRHPQHKPTAINISMVGTFPLMKTAKSLGIVVVIATGNDPEAQVEQSATEARSLLQMTTMKPWVVTAAMSEILPAGSSLPADSYYVRKNFYGSFVRDGVKYRVINVGTSCQTVAMFCFSVPIHRLTRRQLPAVAGTKPRLKVRGNRGLEVVLSDGRRHFVHGASFAAPTVVAAMAYLKAKWPEADNDLLMERLLLTSTLVGRDLSELHTSLAEISPSRSNLAGNGISARRGFNRYLKRVVTIRFHEHFGRGIINVARALQPICLQNQQSCIYASDETTAELGPELGLSVMQHQESRLKKFQFRDDLGSVFQIDLTGKINFREPEGVHIAQVLNSMASEVDIDIVSGGTTSMHARISKQLQIRTSVGEPLSVATNSQRQQLLLTSLPAVYPYQNLLPKVRSFHAHYTPSQSLLGLGVGFATAVDNFRDNYVYLTLKTEGPYLQLSYTIHYAQEQNKLLNSSFGGGFGKVAKTSHLYHNLEISFSLGSDATLFANYGYADVFADFTATPALFQFKPRMRLQNFAFGLAKQGILNHQDSFTLILTTPLTLFPSTGNNSSAIRAATLDYPWRVDTIYRYKFADQGLFLLFANARSGIRRKYLYGVGCALVLKLD